MFDNDVRDYSEAETPSLVLTFKAAMFLLKQREMSRTGSRERASERRPQPPSRFQFLWMGTSRFMNPSGHNRVLTRAYRRHPFIHLNPLIRGPIDY